MEKLGQPKMMPVKRSECTSDMRTTASLAPTPMVWLGSERGRVPGLVLLPGPAVGSIRGRFDRYRSLRVHRVRVSGVGVREPTRKAP